MDYKKLLKRSELWIILFVVGTFADEYIKEGYLFKPSDLTNLMLTHEKLAVIGIVSILIIRVYKRLKWK